MSSGEENSIIVESRVGDRHHQLSVGFDLKPGLTLTTDTAEYTSFTIQRKMNRFDRCIADIRSSKSEDVLVKAIITLSTLIIEDPRLRDHIENQDIALLAYYGQFGNSSKLRHEVALLIPRLKNWPLEHSLLPTFESLKTLIRSKVNELCYEVLVILTAIATDYPSAHQAIIDTGLLDCVNEFFDELRPQDFKAITQCAKFLSVFCCKNPRFPPEKKEVVLNIVKTIFQATNIDGVMPHACRALYYLSCDQYLQIGKRDFQKLVWLTIWDDSLVVIPALMVLGNIFRWGPDHQIKSMISKDVLKVLGRLLKNKNECKLVQREACWIISNITARSNIEESSKRYRERSHKRKRTRQSTHRLIVRLSHFLCLLGKDKSDKSDKSDVQMDAAWAILNYFTQDFKEIKF